MENVFTHRDLLTLELLSEAYNEAVKKYKRAISRSEKWDLKRGKAKELNIAFGICHFAYSLDIERPIIKLNFLDVLKKAMLAMGYSISEYIDFTIEECETKTLAKLTLEHRKKVLKKMVQYVKTRIHEKSK
jgi:hypothetical protein